MAGRLRGYSWRGKWGEGGGLTGRRGGSAMGCAEDGEIDAVDTDTGTALLMVRADREMDE